MTRQRFIFCRIHHRPLSVYKPKYCAWYCPEEGCESFITDETRMMLARRERSTDGSRGHA